MAYVTEPPEKGITAMCQCGHWQGNHGRINNPFIFKARCGHCECPEQFYTVPRHLAHAIKDRAWTYIVLLSAFWNDRYWGSITPFDHKDQQIKDWLILNWWVSYLCNPSVENKQHLTKWALEYRLVSNLELIEALGEAKCLNT